MPASNRAERGIQELIMMTGEVTDRSHLCNFQWYEWIKFHRIGPEAAYPYPSEHLGRCLGSARNKGTAMSQILLLINGKVIPVLTLKSLTQAEIDSSLEWSKRDEFDANIKKLYGTYNSVHHNWTNRRRKDSDGVQYIDDTNDYDDDGENVDPSFGNEEMLEQTTHSMPQVDSIPDFDSFLHAEVLLPRSGEVKQAATILGQSTDLTGDPIGEYSPNPMINTRVYDVMFPDGEVQQYSANVIAQSLYDLADEDGYRYQFLDEIIGHKKLKDTLDKSEGYLVSSNGHRKRVKSTKGWQI